MSDDQTMRYDVECEAIIGIIVACLLSAPVWCVVLRWIF